MDAGLNFLETIDGRLAYSISGHGRPVLLLHGIPSSSFLWRHVRERLTAAYEVWTFDLLGFGASDKPEAADLRLPTQAKRLCAALEQLGWQKGALVGHDIGGGIAQLMCCQAPELFEALILVDTIAYDSFPEPGIARLKDPVWDKVLGDPSFQLCKGFAKGLQKGISNQALVTPELVSAYAHPFAGVEGRLAYLRAARALRTEDLADAMPAVEELDLPTLIVWGETDCFQPLDYGARLAIMMRNARLELIPGAGHFLPEDAPDELAARIDKFLYSNGRPKL